MSPSLATVDLQSRDEIQALFAEARRRRRRIRLTGLATGLALAAAAAVISAALTSHPPKPADANRGPAGHTGRAKTAAGSPLVAWVDGDFRLHLGDLATRTQHVVTQINADPAMPLVQVAGRLYWINQGGDFVHGAFWPTTVEELNLATGKSTDIGPGEYVFPSADKRHLYISQTDDSLSEITAGGQEGKSRLLTLPPGWYLPGGYSLAVANGIVVQSNNYHAIRHPPQLAVWNPRSGLMRVIGRGGSASLGPPMGAAIDAYTPSHAGYSLLAWMPACQYPWSCPIRITNTSTLASVTLRSPFRYGFALGGAFSPDGKQLAVFVNSSPGDGGGTAELAIADTTTGALRILGPAHFPIGEDMGWARWLPDGNQLIVIGANDPYLVNTQPLSARSLGFVHRGAQTINFSAIVFPSPG